MSWLAWIVVVFAAIEGGWLAFDGSHALIAGDYVTPNTGKYAGQLGPWSEVVSAVGIEPRSTLMKTIHVVLGAAWLVVNACFILRLEWAWWGMIALAVAGLWYLPFGTLLSAVQIVILLMPSVRAPAA